MDPLSRELALGGSAGIKKFSCNEKLVDISVLNTLKGDRITPEAVTILRGTEFGHFNIKVQNNLCSLCHFELLLYLCVTTSGVSFSLVALSGFFVFFVLGHS